MSPTLIRLPVLDADLGVGTTKKISRFEKPLDRQT